MKKSEIKEMQVQFEAWIATLDERIFDWLQEMTDNQRVLFDYSIESLDEVERFLISKFRLDDLRDEKNKFAIDGAVSYVFSIFMKHLPNYQCLIELKDKKNLLFNLPAINTNPRIGVDFSPYFFLPSIINLKSLGVLRFQIEIKKKKYLEQYGTEK